MTCITHLNYASILIVKMLTNYYSVVWSRVSFLCITDKLREIYCDYRSHKRRHKTPSFMKLINPILCRSQSVTNPIRVFISQGPFGDLRVHNSILKRLYISISFNITQSNFPNFQKHHSDIPYTFWEHSLASFVHFNNLFALWDYF